MLNAMNREHRTRIAGFAVIAGGVVVALVAILAEQLGLGEEAARGMFGWKRVSLLVAGLLAVAIGLVMATWPRAALAVIDRLDPNSGGIGPRARPGRLPPNRILARLVLAAMIAGVALNVTQFPRIEERVAGNWRAINTYDSSALDRYSNAEQRYGFYLAIGRHAPNSQMIVPPPEEPHPTRLPSIKQRLHGMARITELESREYDPFDLAQGLNLTPHVIASGPTESETGEYQVAVLDGEAEELIFLMAPNSPFIAVDTRLLPHDLYRGLSDGS